MVLLKNEDGILPLAQNEKTAFIGGFAKTPRFQGGGSSHINCFKISSAGNLSNDELQKLCDELNAALK